MGDVHEYVFGEVKRCGVTYEALKVKGDSPTALSGITELKRSYDDAIIYDRFKVVEKYKSMVDKEKNYYDWYIITDHYRYEDKYTPNIGKVEERINGDISDTQDAIMETYEATEINAANIDLTNEAIMELYEMIAGGEES